MGGMPGHSLVTTMRHAETVFELTDEESEALGRTVAHTAGVLRAELDPAGVLIQQNNGIAAFQTVSPRPLPRHPQGRRSVPAARAANHDAHRGKGPGLRSVSAITGSSDTRPRVHRIDHYRCSWWTVPSGRGLAL